MTPRLETLTNRPSYAALSVAGQQAVDLWCDDLIAWTDVPQDARTFLMHCAEFRALRTDLGDIAVTFTLEGADQAALVHLYHLGATVTLLAGQTIPLMLPPGQTFDLEITIGRDRRTMRLVARAGETSIVESRSTILDRRLVGVRVENAESVGVLCPRCGLPLELVNFGSFDVLPEHLAGQHINSPTCTASYLTPNAVLNLDRAVPAADLTNRHPEGLEG